jgi:hypothetical protein
MSLHGFVEKRPTDRSSPVWGLIWRCVATLVERDFASTSPHQQNLRGD